MRTYLLIHAWVAGIAALFLGGFAGVKYANARDVNEDIEAAEEVREALEKTGPCATLDRMIDKRATFALQSSVYMIAAAACVVFFGVIQYALNYFEMTLALVAADAFFTLLFYGMFGYDKDRVVIGLTWASLIVMMFGLGLGFWRAINETEASVSGLAADLAEMSEAAEAGEDWFERYDLEPMRDTIEATMKAELEEIPTEAVYDGVLDAYVTTRKQGDGTVYTLTREDPVFGFVRTVEAWCMTPNWQYAGETGCSTKYIYYDIEPYGYTTRWRLVNNYGYGSTLADMLVPGRAVYQLKLAKDALELDSEMLELVLDALDGSVSWMQTEYAAYLNDDGEVNLGAYLAHYGYEFAGLDTYESPVAECEWLVYENRYRTIRLDGGDQYLCWIQCDNDYMKTSFMPLCWPYDDCSVPATIHGKHIKASTEALAVLMQYIDYEHLYMYDVYDGPAVEPEYMADLTA